MYNDMNEIIENYLTIGSDYGPVEFKEKGSRFISYAIPINSVEECNKRLSILRKKYYDCTHICSAYIIGEGKEDIFRHNDDGEPSGTAGLPIYSEIKGAKLFNILIPVIRYYGGTKLGTGGLIRAYGNAAKFIIQKIKPVKFHIKKTFKIQFKYNFTGDVMNICEKNKTIIIKQEYMQDEIEFIIDVPIGQVDKINKILINKSGGKVELLPTD